MSQYEEHVFHSGTSKQYHAFVTQNRDRIVTQELGNDRVIVYCRPVKNSENVVFVAGHFPGGI
jgi:alpha-D-ribose 1-methylphosphonate 5-phosphate C-P lyase